MEKVLHNVISKITSGATFMIRLLRLLFVVFHERALCAILFGALWLRRLIGLLLLLLLRDMGRGATGCSGVDLRKFTRGCWMKNLKPLHDRMFEFNLFLKRDEVMVDSWSD